ncbi:MAG: prepilin-type N-terminal cleavage/methylation domain-containing protein [Armatimonadetes bacterium]|nr:prepilin-type N-terminal cleavage/methylation domain-containing protein [Armatimonadota bacterium]
MKQHKSAFTLIELLVVIAIIAILAAILFPVFAQAKLAAKKASALSNIKQTALGVIMYQSDYDDMFPMGSGACWWYPLDGGWSLDTQPYIKNLPILRSPADPLSKNGWMGWLASHDQGVPISFVANGLMDWDGAAWSLFGVMGMVQNVPPASNRCGASAWMGRTVTNATAVTYPADTIMLAERYGSQIAWGTGDFVCARSLGDAWWDGAGHGTAIPDATRNGNPYTFTNWEGNTVTAQTDNRQGAITNAYSKKSVFSFADGHAATMTPSTTDPDYFGNPAKNKWNAYRN